MRLDLYLAQNGMAPSRTAARSLIEQGLVLLHGVPVTKPAAELPPDAPPSCITLREGGCPYVSRGGLKLAAAIEAFSLTPRGLVMLDVGASTGGFTDCLLQAGASFVYAVDSGHAQLHPSLRGDARVESREGVNARYLCAGDFGQTIDAVVMDVSFISQTLIHPAIAATLRPGGWFVSLIKPQFEVGRGGVGKGGIVRSDSLRQAGVERVLDSAAACGFALRGVIPSPIPGGDGNTEFLACFDLTKEGSL